MLKPALANKANVGSWRLPEGRPIFRMRLLVSMAYGRKGGAFLGMWRGSREEKRARCDVQTRVDSALNRALALRRAQGLELVETAPARDRLRVRARARLRSLPPESLSPPLIFATRRLGWTV